MFFTIAQLKAATARLAEAKLTGAHACSQPRLDADGAGVRTVEGVRRRDQSFSMSQQVPLGEHGTDFLQIDPISGEIRCGACAGELDAAPKG